MGSLIKKGVVIEVIFRSKLTTGELYISQTKVGGGKDIPGKRKTLWKALN